MSESSWDEWFSQEMDHLASGRPLAPGQYPTAAPPELQADMEVAKRLLRLDLSAESQVRGSLRANLELSANNSTPALAHAPLSTRARSGTEMPANSHRSLPSQRLVMTAALFSLLALLLIFNRPVLAAVQHMLGYGYIPEAGFIRLSDSRLIKGPVVQENGSGSVAVRQGLSGPNETRLWLESNPAAYLQNGARLKLPDGTYLEQRSQSGLTVGRRLLSFPALPPDVQVSLLELPGGWQIPLEWIPASAAGLAPTQINLPSSASTTPGQVTSEPCLVSGDRVRVCARAALVDASGTHLLLHGEALNGPQDFAWLPAMTTHPILLKDENGQVYSLLPATMDKATEQVEPGSLTLRFGPLPESIHVVTLLLPGLVVQLGASVLTLPGPFELTFRLPERQVTFSPTPHVLEDTRAPSPVPTP